MVDGQSPRLFPKIAVPVGSTLTPPLPVAFDRESNDHFPGVKLAHVVGCDRESLGRRGHLEFIAVCIVPTAFTEYSHRASILGPVYLG